MTNEIRNPNAENGGEAAPKYDLEERTARLGEAVIRFVKMLTFTPVNSPLVSQLVRSATSIGANYCEANDAESKKDFRHKIGICRKEARETKHWLRMIAVAEPNIVKKQDDCGGNQRNST